MPDYDIASKIQTPDAFKTLGNMMGVAGAAQQLQRGNIALQRERETLQPSIEQAKSQAKRAEIETTTSQWRLDSEQANAGRQLLGGLLSQPAVINGDSQGSMDALMQVEEQARNMGIPEAKIRANLSPFYTAAAHSPQNLAQMIKQTIVSGIQPAAQGAAVAPAGPMVTNQAQTGMMNLNPLAPNTSGPAIVPGTVINNQIPLGERQNVSINPVTQSPMVTSKDAFGNVQGVTQAPTGPGVPQLKPGEPQAIGTNAATSGAHWAATLADSNKAAQNVGVLQEIKKYAPGAVTGVVQDRRSFLAGLAGLIGMDVGQMERTETDLLAKNSSMLSLAGGDTNLAKTLAETANPNIHMTKEAIIKAADQVIGQQQLSIARAKFLRPYTNNPEGYAQAATEFNANADPRVLQYPSLNLKDKVDMRNAMSPQEREAFGKKLKFFQTNGML